MSFLAFWSRTTVAQYFTSRRFYVWTYSVTVAWKTGQNFGLEIYVEKLSFSYIIDIKLSILM